MNPEGYVEYKRREFCKDVKCPVQLELDTQTEASPAYEKTRQKCSTACLYTTWQFHHWLIEKGYVILVNSKLENKERTVLVSMNQDLLEWIDKQVRKGKFSDKDKLIENAIAQYKKEQET